MKLKAKTFVFIVIILFVSVLASRNLFKNGYFPMHDDIQVMRLYEMEKCFRDGQIPCRWVPDMGGGYGHPLFNYHQVFPYYLGMFFRFFGLTLVDVVKLLFIITFFFSGMFMFFLGRELWGDKAGLVSAVVFVFSPYRAVDVYVRGALTEIFAITFFPLIFLSLYKYVKEEKFQWFLFSILSLTGLFLSHNIMTILFTPLAFIWSFIWILKLNKQCLWAKTILIFFWSFLISAFFLIPAFFEKSLVTMDTLTTDYYDFRNHFVTLKQLFIDRSFGYGPSRPGPVDDMSFQLGLPQWIITLTAGAWFLKNIITGKNIRKSITNESFLVFSLFIGWFLSTLMTHAKSFYIWSLLTPIAKFVQFPWRFLALSMFFCSLLAGSLIFYVKKEKISFLITLLIIFLTILLNYNYFKPLKILKIGDKDILSGEEWRRQSLTTFQDYYPVKVKEIPKDLAFNVPKIIDGLGKIDNFNNFSNRWSFSVNAVNDLAVMVPVFDFPRWMIMVDKKESGYLIDDKLGLIIVNLTGGNHQVEGYLKNTPLREASNNISVMSFALLVLVTIKQLVFKKNEKN